MLIYRGMRFNLCWLWGHQNFGVSIMGVPNKFIYFYGGLKIFREISKIPPTGAQINKAKPLNQNCQSTCKKLNTLFFYKNGGFSSEPRIFLTLICYFSNLLPPTPFGDCFKLLLRTKALFSSSQIHSKANIFRDSQKI